MVSPFHGERMPSVVLNKLSVINRVMFFPDRDLSEQSVNDEERKKGSQEMWRRRLNAMCDILLQVAGNSPGNQ
jgi:hypothetical protein